MNYIKQLQEKNKNLQATITDASQEIQDLMEYLGGDKFKGIDNNFVNAREMQSRIIKIRMYLNS